MESKQSSAILGGQKVVTQGVSSTTSVSASYPGALVTVFNFGTATLATIFADSIGTPLANPFTSSLVTGDWIFYAANGHYTVVMSGGGMPFTETITDVLLNDPTSSTTSTATAFISSSATPATSGVLRLASTDAGPMWKSNLGGADLGFTKNASDVVLLNAAFTISGAFSTSGNPITGSVITGATGVFSGAVTGASYSGGPIAGTTGTFSGAVTAVGVSSTTGTFSGAITGASYTGGPISGTTGTFSGNVSTSALSATTGAFSSNVTITGTLAIGGGTALATTNQSGTGSIAMTNGATFVAPILGVATATSYNGLTVTSTTGTFTLTNGKTFAVDNSIELAGTDGVKQTFPATAPTGGTLAYGVPTFQQFVANGVFTIPVGVTAVKVTVVGGGGAGGGGVVGNSGGGGGAGGTALKWLSSLTPGNTLTVVVGAGGAGVSGAAGGNGTNSSVASGTQIITTVSGTGGTGGSNNGVGLVGGDGSNGDINMRGGPGGNNTITVGSGPGGNSSMGGGGTPAGGNATGNAAGLYGGGGSGGGGGVGNTTGGAGAAGTIVFEWVR